MNTTNLGLDVKVKNEDRIALSDTFLQSINDLVTIVDLNGVFVYTSLPENKDFQKIFKHNGNGNLTIDSYVPGVKEEIEKIYNITKEEKSWTGEVSVPSHHGESFKMFIQTNLLFDSNNNPTSIISFCSHSVDIEQTKQSLDIANNTLFAQKKIYTNLYNQLLHADNELQKEKQKTEHVENTINCILSSIPTSVAVFKDRVILDVNLIFCDLLGYTKEELVNKSSRMIYQNKEDFEYVDDVLYYQLKKKSIASGEIRWMKKNGETFLANVKTSKIDPDDPSKGVIVTAIEIENINDKDSIVIESEKSYRDLFDCVTDTIYILDKDGNFVSVNESAVKMYGYDKQYFVGKNPGDLSAPNKNDMEYIVECLSKAYHGEPQQFRFWGIRSNGEIFPKDVRVSRGRYFGKDVVYALATDISNRVVYEDQLKFAKEKAEESDNLKSKFLENISHEIRTPMNGILGFADLLRDASVPEYKRENYLDVIERSGERMLKIIDDIVDISKIESDQMTLYYSQFNVIELLEFIYNFFIPEAEKKGLELSLSVEISEDEKFIYSDKEKLYAVLANLVKNAIKYSDKGKILIKCSMHENGYLFSVNDNGIGIPSEHLDDIFVRFYQVKDSLNGARQGSGLGLSISKAFVEMLNGKIWLNSKVGVGSSFYFNIPVENAVAL